MKRKSKNRNQPRSARAGRKVIAPVAESKVFKSSKPVMNGKVANFRIQHREYFADVVSATGTPSSYSVDSYPMNPGQSAMFPWLSFLAQNFESYIFNKLNIIYEPACATTLGGVVILAPDYDAADAAPSDKKQAMTYQDHIEGPPWVELDLISTKSNLHKAKTNYVRSGPQPAGTDIKTYDIGNLYVISQGTTASTTLGQLFVEYDVTFLTPQTGGTALPLGGTIAAEGSISPTVPLGDGSPNANNRGITYDAKTGDIFIQYPGEYILSTEWLGTSFTTAAGNIAAATGLTSFRDSYVRTSTQLNETWGIITTLANVAIAYTLSGSPSLSSGEIHMGTMPIGTI